MTQDPLETDLAALLRPPPAQPSQDRVDAVRALAARLRDGRDAAADRVEDRVEDTGTGDPVGPDDLDAPRPTDRPSRRSPARLLALAAGAAVLVAAGAVGAVVTTGGGTASDDVLARGTPEFSATLSGGGADVDLDGSRAPEGRIVVVSSRTLPVIPPGEYYELWFVSADDAPGSPDRISAGTFHPDYDDGTTDVVLHAAVDPTLFGDVEITRETADGDPAPSGDVVLRGGVDLLAGG